MCDLIPTCEYINDFSDQNLCEWQNDQEWVLPTNQGEWDWSTDQYTWPTSQDLWSTYNSTWSTYNSTWATDLDAWSTYDSTWSTDLDVWSTDRDARLTDSNPPNIGLDCDPTKLYFKITNQDEKHNSYQYTDGLNILRERFNFEGSCVGGGLYFTNPKHILDYLSYGVHLRDITLPADDPDLKMVRDPSGGKWRANKIILGKRYMLSDVNTYKYMISKGTPAKPACDQIVKIIAESQKWNEIKLILDDTLTIKIMYLSMLDHVNKNMDPTLMELLVSGGLFGENTDDSVKRLEKKLLEKGKLFLAIESIYLEEWDTVKTHFKNKQYINYEPFVMALLGSGHLEMIKLAIKEGMDFAKYKNHAYNIASTSVYILNKYGNGNFRELVKMAIQHGVNLQKKGSKLLRKACEYGDFDFAKYLINSGAKYNTHNDLPLRCARTQGDVTMIDFLTEKSRRS